jgi:hypothetical protein
MGKPRLTVSHLRSLCEVAARDKHDSAFQLCADDVRSLAVGATLGVETR